MKKSLKHASFTASLLALVSTLSLPTIAAAPDISRIEPANWWAGMKNPNLQLLVYGEDIGHLNAKVNHPSVSVEKIVRVENNNYLFLYLKIAPSVTATNVEIELFDKNQRVKTIEYPLLAREQDSAMRKGFDSSDVMYLITPDRFANGDTRNDNIDGMLEKLNRGDKNGRHGGDIEGVRQSLDYISDMGFTAIWLNPVLENDMHRLSYHGYAATDFYKVDARFGSNEEYKRFIAEAKSKGIKVIMDMILNHSGSEHWFVKDMPSPSWINYEGKYTPTSHVRQTVQDLYASEFDKQAFSDGWFDTVMPDLNQNNELMADYLIQNSLWWIEYTDLAGIRMDTYPYPDKNFMARWTCEVMSEYPHFNIVGEEWVTVPATAAYWQRGKVNHDGYSSCLPSLMDFPMQQALIDGLTGDDKPWRTSLVDTYEKLALDYLYSSPSDLVTFADNHDMSRILTQVNGDEELFYMAINYLLTMRGTPQIYYGTEILMDNNSAPHDHAVIRSDFPGGWQGDKANAFTQVGLSAAQKQTQEHFKKLLNWRKEKSVIHHGKLMQFVPFEGVYVYFRYDDNDTVMVIMNKNEEAKAIDLSRFSERLNGFKTATDVVTGQTQKFDDKQTGKLKLNAKTTHIFELK